MSVAEIRWSVCELYSRHREKDLEFGARPSVLNPDSPAGFISVLRNSILMTSCSPIQVFDRCLFARISLVVNLLWPFVHVSLKSESFNPSDEQDVLRFLFFFVRTGFKKPHNSMTSSWTHHHYVQSFEREHCVNIKYHSKNIIIKKLS